MNNVLRLILVNLGARRTTKLAQSLADNLQTFLKVSDLNVNVARLGTAASASNLADASLLKRIGERVFYRVASAKRKLGVLEYNL